MKTKSDVSILVHCDAAKPTITSIGRISPLLINFPWTRCYRAQLVPTNPGVVLRGIAVRSHSMIEQQHLVIAEIAIREPLHHVTVRKRVEQRGNTRLLDAKLVAARIAVERVG